jgi:hypothetical protein
MPGKPADWEPVNIHMMAALGVAFDPRRADFNPAEGRAGFPFPGIGNMRQRFFLGHENRLARLEVRGKVVIGVFRLMEVLVSLMRAGRVVPFPEA